MSSLVLVGTKEQWNQAFEERKSQDVKVDGYTFYKIYFVFLKKQQSVRKMWNLFVLNQRAALPDGGNNW